MIKEILEQQLLENIEKRLSKMGIKPGDKIDVGSAPVGHKENFFHHKGKIFHSVRKINNYYWAIWHHPDNPDQKFRTVLTHIQKSEQ